MIPLLIALALVIGLPLLFAETATRFGCFDRSMVITFVFGLESIARGVHALIVRPGWFQPTPS